MVFFSMNFSCFNWLIENQYACTSTELCDRADYRNLGDKKVYQHLYKCIPTNMLKSMQKWLC